MSSTRRARSRAKAWASWKRRAVRCSTTTGPTTKGVITKVNMIVATAGNAWAMNHSVNLVAKRYVDGNNLQEGMLNRVEGAIRAYDPCLSCSTHAMGQMPMHIELVAPGWRGSGHAAPRLASEKVSA